MLLAHVKKETAAPSSVKGAMSSPQRAEWLSAMVEEVGDMQRRGTWSLCDLPPGEKAIGCKFVFSLKCDENGEVAKYKARLMAMGNEKSEDYDKEELFAPTAHFATMRMLLSLAVAMNWDIHSMDVSKAFLNGRLPEDTVVYMRQPPLLADPDRPKAVCRLPWNSRICARPSIYRFTVSHDARQFRARFQGRRHVW